ncbi:MAG: hypothetical protein PHV82_13820 [Victivallaceae bacterium]|nr:hypothetical protein [Victivallaceae bacterium]
MLKNFFLVLVLFILGGVSAQQTDDMPKDASTERELAIKKIEAQLEKSTVLEYLKKCTLAIQKGNKKGKALASREYSTYRITLENYLQYRWFTADTGLSQKWLSDIYDLVKYMGKTRDIIETAIINGYTKTPKAQQAVKYYDVAYKRFLKLVQKPVEVPMKIQRQQQLQKVLWQRAMRKKYKLKEKQEQDIL